MGYDAFISYSHRADLELAPVVRDALQRLAKPWHRRRALSVFLDQASLEVSAELGSALDDRLEDTRWLVLFMSTESARSKWVGEEIAAWAATKSKDRIALVLTSGDVVWDAAARDFDYERSTAVSAGLRGVYAGQESEPLFLDLRWTKTDVPDGEKSLGLVHARFKNDIATIAAPIHGIPKDELVGRDVQEFRRTRRVRRAAISALTVLTVIAVTLGILARLQRNEAVRQRNWSEARRLATESRVNAAEQTDLALALALDSLATTETPEGWDALRIALSRPVLARSPMVAHAAGVNRVLFASGGSTLVTAGGDGVVALWDHAGRRKIADLRGHAEATDVWDVALSPDGSMLATAGGDGTVRLWAADDGAPRGELTGHVGAVWDVAFASGPGEPLLATASADGTVRLWDLARRAERDVIALRAEGRGVEAWAVAFSADGSRVLFVGGDGSLRARGVAPGSAVETLLSDHDEWRGPTKPGVAFGPDRATFAVAASDRTIQVWDLAEVPPTVRTLAGHDGFVVDLAFSPDGTRLVSASQDRSVRVWDVASGAPVGDALTGHDEPVFTVAFDPTGSRVASGSADRSVRVWDLGAGERVGRRLEHGGPVLAVALSADGSRAATAGEDSVISVWCAPCGSRLHRIERSHDGEWVQALSFSPDARVLASAGTDGHVRLWDVRTGAPAVAAPAAHGGWVHGVTFSPDGTLLASAGDDGKVRLWCRGLEATVGPPTAGHADVAAVLAFDPGGRTLVSGGWDGAVRWWDVATGGALGRELRCHDDAVLDLRFEPGGAHLLSVSRDGVVLRTDARTRAVTVLMDAELAGETRWTAAALSADGAVLVAADPDGSVRRWDPASGAPIGAALRGHAARVTGLHLSRDASLVASAGGEDGAARLWPAPARWPELARAAVGRRLPAGAPAPLR